ncbi:ABC transporter ATP-binding protein [Anaerolentibacter hominis]|uniref:ABC transporter ATP-binding protein n=1 Tax=Anaerolentibacter hominis TaxID=3079009 RepID=UPI0031B82DCD
MEKILEIQNISKNFGGILALQNVNAEIYKGEIVAIIGPNGSGKTTLLNVITGVYVPDNGHVLLEGVPVEGLAKEKICRAGIARTFQNIRLFKSRTVLDNVLIGSNQLFESGLADIIFNTAKSRREEGIYREKALEWLDFVGLKEKESMRSENLPYAHQRFLEIARAMATDPKVILLDEPAAGMSAVEIEHLDALLRRIQKLGITVVMIEHIMDLVRGVSDRVYVLNNGKNIAEGTFAQIENDPVVKEAYLGTGGKKD